MLTLLLSALLSVACTKAPEEPHDSEPAEEADTDTDADSDTDADADADADTDTDSDTDPPDSEAPLTGEELYKKYCSACHGDDGKGVPDAGPAIAHELHHTDEELISVMINGKKEMDPVPVTEDEAHLIVDWMRESF